MNYKDSPRTPFYSYKRNQFPIPDCPQPKRLVVTARGAINEGQRYFEKFVLIYKGKMGEIVNLNVLDFIQNVQMFFTSSF